MFVIVNILNCNDKNKIETGIYRAKREGKKTLKFLNNYETSISSKIGKSVLPFLGNN